MYFSLDSDVSSRSLQEAKQEFSCNFALYVVLHMVSSTFDHDNFYTATRWSHEVCILAQFSPPKMHTSLDHSVTANLYKLAQSMM
jgi:hypothetical protein